MHPLTQSFKKCVMCFHMPILQRVYSGEPDWCGLYWTASLLALGFQDSFAVFENQSFRAAVPKMSLVNTTDFS